MVHPAIGAAFIGGGLTGMASRHVGTLNVLSMTAGTFGGVWIAQNYPTWVPNLKQELRRFALAASDDDDGDDTPLDFSWVETVDQSAVGEEVLEAVTSHKKVLQELNDTRSRVKQLEQRVEHARVLLDSQLNAQRDQEDVLSDVTKEARSRIIERMVLLKQERRDRHADREKIERQLNMLRKLRDEELVSTA